MNVVNHPRPLDSAAPPILDLEVTNKTEIIDQRKKCGGRKHAIFLALIFLLVAGASVAILVTTVFADKRNQDTSASSGNENLVDEYSSSKFRDELEAVISGAISNPSNLLDPLSPQSRSLDWIAFSDTIINSVIDTNLVQRYALMTFYFSTNGPLWAMTDLWGELTDSHECSFTGVECDPETMQVFKLDLKNRRMTGDLPEELALLTDLDIIKFRENTLKGTLPEAIFSQLTKMVTFDVGQNELSSTLSSAIGNWKDLSKLFLQDNDLSGPLPESLKELNISVAMITNTNLEGPIFDFVMQWTNLKKLVIGTSLFTGEMPTEIVNLKSLEDLLIDGTKASVALPTEIGLMTSLERLRIKTRGPGGTIPSEIGNLQRLNYLHIEGHQYNGAIPSEIGNLFLLTTLAFQHCSLTGTIPSEMGKLTALQELGLTGNFLSGTIPSELGVLGESLAILSVIDNRLHGRMPIEMCSIQYIIQYGCEIQCECCAMECGWQ